MGSRKRFAKEFPQESDETREVWATTPERKTPDSSEKTKTRPYDFKHQINHKLKVREERTNPSKSGPGTSRTSPRPTAAFSPLLSTKRCGGNMKSGTDTAQALPRILRRPPASSHVTVCINIHTAQSGYLDSYIR